SLRRPGHRAFRRHADVKAHVARARRADPYTQDTTWTRLGMSRGPKTRRCRHRERQHRRDPRKHVPCETTLRAVQRIPSLTLPFTSGTGLAFDARALSRPILRALRPVFDLPRPRKAPRSPAHARAVSVRRNSKRPAGKVIGNGRPARCRT